mgnify:CR=1 FL=1
MAGATNSPNFADDVASSAVADRIINSSSDMQAQAARLTEAGLPPSSLTTEQLVQALRSPAAVEDAVPGYRANIADRTQDPGLATLAYNTDAVSPGAASARRVGNETAVNETITGLAPAADPDRFRTDLQAGVDNRIGEALSSQEAAQFAFDDILQAIQPSMREASARGSSIRSALSDAYSGAQDAVRQRYSQIDGDGTLMDPSGLVESARGVDANLAPNDAKRFRPPEADTIQEMMPGGRNPLRDTGLVNEFNRPVFAENGQSSPRGTGETLPSMPGETIGQPGTTVPMSDISAIRTGLTDDLRAAQAAGNTQQARVLSKYVDAVDGYLEENMSEGLRAALDDARAARRDVGERFERPGTALESVLARRQGGGFALDDSAVPSRIAQPDQGKLTDLRAALSEAGGDPRLREGLADEVRSSVMQNGLLNKPQALGRYMADRQVLLSEFPELRTQLQNAGASRTALAEAERVARDTTKRLTTPGRSGRHSRHPTGQAGSPLGTLGRGQTVRSPAGRRYDGRDALERQTSPRALRRPQVLRRCGRALGRRPARSGKYQGSVWCTCGRGRLDTRPRGGLFRHTSGAGRRLGPCAHGVLNRVSRPIRFARSALANNRGCGHSRHLAAASLRSGPEPRD